MPGQRIGSAIAAVFGLVYLLINTGPLPTGWTVTLRVIGAAAFVAVLIAVVRSGRPSPADGGPRRGVFTRGYWWVVIAEVVALFAGVRILSGPLDLPEAGVAWVSVVVGVHFFAFAALFGERFFHWLGGAITTCGVIGLVLAGLGAGEPAIALVAGVLPGALLLGFGWWGAHRSQDPASSAPEVVAAEAR